MWGTRPPSRASCQCLTQRKTQRPDAIEGINKDTYVLTVSLGVYTGKLISVSIAWTNPGDDYDLYVFKHDTRQQVGQSAGGAPQTGEATSFDP